MSKFTNTAVAVTMAFTLIAGSLSAAEAGNRKARNLALGLGALFVGAAIINESHKSRHHKRRHLRRHERSDCYYEYREVWSRHYDDYIEKRVKVCY